jgi:hypothetical protein
MTLSTYQVRTLWTAVQFVALCATIPFGSIVMDMATAEPNQSYTTQAGQVVHCDGLLRTRGPNHAVCSRFGTINTNPKIFVASSLALAIAVGVFGIASKPGRGFAGPPIPRKK